MDDQVQDEVEYSSDFSSMDSSISEVKSFSAKDSAGSGRGQAAASSPHTSTPRRAVSARDLESSHDRILSDGELRSFEQAAENLGRSYSSRDSSLSPALSSELTTLPGPDANKEGRTSVPVTGKPLLLSTKPQGSVSSLSSDLPPSGARPASLSLGRSTQEVSRGLGAASSAAGNAALDANLALKAKKDYNPKSSHKIETEDSWYGLGIAAPDAVSSGPRSMPDAADASETDFHYRQAGSRETKAATATSFSSSHELKSTETKSTVVTSRVLGSVPPASEPTKGPQATKTQQEGRDSTTLPGKPLSKSTPAQSIAPSLLGSKNEPLKTVPSESRAKLASSSGADSAPAARGASNANNAPRFGRIKEIPSPREEQGSPPINNPLPPSPPPVPDTRRTAGVPKYPLQEHFPSIVEPSHASNSKGGKDRISKQQASFPHKGVARRDEDLEDPDDDIENQLPYQNLNDLRAVVSEHLRSTSKLYPSLSFFLQLRVCCVNF
jgi:hypothetical protein